MSYDQLKILAESYHDTQKLRIATELRMRHHAAVPEALLEHCEALRTTEHRLGLVMKRQFRATAPEIAAWVKATPGLGEHLMARLLGAVGDPIHAEPWLWMDDSPEGHTCSERCGKGRHLVALEPFDRTARQLAQYCGHGDPTDRRRKGMDAADALRLGNPVAKMVLHLLAESCIKQLGPPRPDESKFSASAELPPAVGDPSTDDEPDVGAPAKSRAARRRSPYRDAYDIAREKYADREDWTPGRQHNAAIRYTAKQIVTDLWRVASGLPPRWKPEEGL